MTAPKMPLGLVAADLALLEIMTIVAGIMLAPWWFGGTVVVLVLSVMALSRGRNQGPRAAARRTVGHGGMSHEFIAQAAAVRPRRRLARRGGVPAFQEYFAEATRYGTPAKP